MEVTATALLCLKTSSRLSCRENSHSFSLPDKPADIHNCMSVHHPYEFAVPVAVRACRGSRSTFCRRWKCWSGCLRSGFPPRSHSRLGAGNNREQANELVREHTHTETKTDKTLSEKCPQSCFNDIRTAQIQQFVGVCSHKGVLTPVHYCMCSCRQGCSLNRGALVAPVVP